MHTEFEQSQKEDSFSVRLLKVLGDFLLLGLSFAVIFAQVFLKYLCSGAAKPALWVVYTQYAFVVGVVSFIVFVLYTAVKGNEVKRIMFWVRIAYLIIWIIYLVGVAYTPAMPVGSC